MEAARDPSATHWGYGHNTGSAGGHGIGVEDTLRDSPRYEAADSKSVEVVLAS